MSASNYSRKDLARDLREGRYTSIGSYPKFFFTPSGDVLSFDAVHANAKRFLREGLAGCSVNWENADLYCDETGERIESAYAEEG